MLYIDIILKNSEYVAPFKIILLISLQTMKKAVNEEANSEDRT